MPDAAPNYNPPGGPGVPDAETWRTEAGVKTARPSEVRPQSEAAQDADNDEDAAVPRNSLGMRTDTPTGHTP
jgi:hypothetical protein